MQSALIASWAVSTGTTELECFLEDGDVDVGHYREVRNLRRRETDQLKSAITVFDRGLEAIVAAKNKWVLALLRPSLPPRTSVS